MSTDLKTTIIGAILAMLTAVQPMINALEGTFDYKDIVQIVIAGFIAALGYYVNRVCGPNKDDEC